MPTAPAPGNKTRQMAASLGVKRIRSGPHGRTYVLAAPVFVAGSAALRIYSHAAGRVHLLRTHSSCHEQPMVGVTMQAPPGVA
jgi:hypothetical protein